MINEQLVQRIGMDQEQTEDDYIDTLAVDGLLQNGTKFALTMNSSSEVLQ